MVIIGRSNLHEVYHIKELFCNIQINHKKLRSMKYIAYHQIIKVRAPIVLQNKTKNNGNKVSILSL